MYGSMKSKAIVCETHVMKWALAKPLSEVMTGHILMGFSYTFTVGLYGKQKKKKSLSKV